MHNKFFFYSFFHLFSSSFVLLRFVNIYKRFIQNQTCIKARYTFYLFIYFFILGTSYDIACFFPIFIESKMLPTPIWHGNNF